MKEIFLRLAREARRIGACWHAEAARAVDPTYALAMRAMCHANAARYWRYAQDSQ